MTLTNTQFRKVLRQTSTSNVKFDVTSRDDVPITECDKLERRILWKEHEGAAFDMPSQTKQ